MQDKAQEISAAIWRWYKQAASMDKGDHEWDVLLEAIKKTVNQYMDDKLNYPLAEDMALAFINHVERLDKLKKGGKP